MATVEFKDTEELNEVFDCRYGRQDRSPCASCPLKVSREKCEAAFFLVMEGRPASEDDITVGGVEVPKCST